MIKRYIALNNLHLSTTIMIGAIEKTIIFKGGKLRPERVNGTFITDDESLQRAIESDNGYGKAFIELNVDGNVEKLEQKNKKCSCYEKIEEVNNLQMAIEWIRHNLSVDFKQNSPIKEVVKLANQHGFDFPNIREGKCNKNNKK